MDAQGVGAWLSDLLARTGPAAPLLLFFAAFVEYVFPPFPGDALVVLGSWYATHGKLSWPVTFAMVTGGAMAGSTVDYAAGRWLGARIDERAAAGKVDRERVERFERAYRRFGGLLLVVNRFLPGVRGFFFLAAGAARIPLWEVLLFGGISAAAWNGLLLAVGAYAVKNLDELFYLFEQYNTAAAAALAVAGAVAIGLWWRWRRSR